MTSDKEEEERASRKSIFAYIGSSIGPGVITGAADDDPSGITTYSVVGAKTGTSLLWTALFTWPLMGCVQMMCARIGMVTGMGLCGAFRKKFPRPILISMSIALLIANTINIAADLAGMGDAAQMLTGVHAGLFVALFGFGICFATIKLRYHQIGATLKWLALALFSYVFAAFLVHPKWSLVARDTFVPTVPRGKAMWGMVVAILGTGISPYLFFWQAGQEVEEEKAKGRRILVQREGATKRELWARRLDIGLGTFFSNVVMFFIILTTALTLHTHGITDIDTSRQAAEALRPIGGDFAYMLYTIGIIGTGLLAIPTLSGSAAYAFAETFDWLYGLDERFGDAISFYVVIIVSTLFGVIINFVNFDPIKALYWSAVLNGLLAPFLLIAIYMTATDKKLMLGQTSSRITRVVVLIAIVAMFGAGAGMFLF